MIRGFSLFRCKDCGKHFIGLDIEKGATAASEPMPCPRCGSMNTHTGLPIPSFLAALGMKMTGNKKSKKK